MVASELCSLIKKPNGIDTTKNDEACIGITISGQGTSEDQSSRSGGLHEEECLCGLVRVAV